MKSTSEGMVKVTYRWEIAPNPQAEFFIIEFDSGSIEYTIDFLEVETACIVPTPGAFLLGGIGITCVGWIKRRKNL